VFYIESPIKQIKLLTVCGERGDRFFLLTTTVV